MVMKRTFVLGDVHGCSSALVKVMIKSGIDPARDRLICLGDVADRGPDTVECFEEILKFRDLVYVMGNHDYWLLRWLKYGEEPLNWLYQGGFETIDSYQKRHWDHSSQVKILHRDLLESAQKYHVDSNGRIFVHAGFNPELPLDEQTNEDGLKCELYWDRSLFIRARRLDMENANNVIGPYSEIFIGHTATNDLDNEAKPRHYCNLWALDQGAVYGGKLTLMNVETKEYWQAEQFKSDKKSKKQ